MRNYLRDIRLAQPSLPFDADTGWRREVARRPEVLAYVSGMALDVRAGSAWARGAWMPFGSGLVAGIRLAQDPPEPAAEVERAFRDALANFPRPETDVQRHSDMSRLYQTGLHAYEETLGHNFKELLDMEFLRDARAKAYAYEAFEVDNASEWTIAAFQAGMVAGARLASLGHVDVSGTQR